MDKKNAVYKERYGYSMQIFYISDIWMILLFFIFWGVFQSSAAFICLKIPDRYFSPDGFLFRERKWEKGGVLYEKIFKVRKWKGFLPDGGAIVKGGYSKKHLLDFSKENLEQFSIESCRAEVTHLIAILPFWIFGFFAPPIVIIYMFIYAIVVNLPCLIAQRYNRLRFTKVIKKYRTK